MKRVWDGNHTFLTQYITENRLCLPISLHCHFSSFLLLLLAWIENKSYFKFSWKKELWKLNFTNDFLACICLASEAVWKQWRNEVLHAAPARGFPLSNKVLLLQHAWHLAIILPRRQPKNIFFPPHFICGILKAKSRWVGQDDIVMALKPGNRAWTSPAPSIRPILLPVPTTKQHNSKMHHMCFLVARFFSEMEK